MISSSKDFNKHNSILLVGCGATHKYLSDIVRPESYKEVLETFGESDLSRAYQILDAMGAPQVFIINLEKIYDLVDAAEMIQEQSFSYIVPLFNATEYFYDVLTRNRKTYYVQFLLRKAFKNQDNESVILTTDTKANLYKDIDAFLADMSSKIRTIKGAATSGEKYRNLVFVANMLENVDYANVYAAGMITTSNIDEYPAFPPSELDLLKDITPTFWMDKEDVEGIELVYFKKHMDSTLTIENLLNLHQSDNKSLVKIFFISRIIKYIIKEMDFSDLIGKTYREYYRRQAENIAEEFLRSIKGHYIIDYKLYEAYPKENPKYPGTVDLYIKYEVQPINCSEWYVIDKKVV